MLESYFVRPTSVDKIQALWLGELISQYANWLTDRQVAKPTALFKIRVLVQFDKYLAERGIRSLEQIPEQTEPFVKHWQRTLGCHSQSLSYKRSTISGPRLAIEELLVLTFPGYTGKAAVSPWPLQQLAPGFQEHLSGERGLRPDTIRGYKHHLRVFERFLKAEAITDMSELTPAIINRFVADSTAGLHPNSRQGRAGALRMLLRFLYRQNKIATQLDKAIPRGRNYKNASIPRAIAWSEVEQVLSTVDRRSAGGKRDYAILMLLANYGLRSQEIAALELDAIDWTRSVFHVLFRKAGNSTTYPLSEPVGAAIVDYLHNARPDCGDRHVFIRLLAPFTGLGHWTVSGRASHHLRRAGIRVYRPGSHTFRHSCVKRMVDADVPFKQIGDYIGHRSNVSTQVYAKVAIHKLRTLVVGEAEEML
jgi:integrase/recombinase XerD